jgi:16S rRNA (adenine1518-N6/adenine1519-N6)-dimethyltransferase
MGRRLDSPSQILRRRGLRPKKSWGQNFLRDEGVLQRIADALEIRPGESVIELGAGLGHLTRFLVRSRARVTAVERDPDLVQLLGELRFENLQVLSADAARLDFAMVAGTSPVAVVGNIPYHLTSPILFRVLDQHATLSRVVLTVQEEVATRITADPGGRDYGLLSVLLSLHFRMEKLFVLGPELFDPPPKVNSAVVRLTPLLAPRAVVASEPGFRRIVKAAFARRRKTILNSLKSDPSLGSSDRLRAALLAQQIDPRRRAETLSVEEFAALARSLQS